jgi:hypothetical protein
VVKNMFLGPESENSRSIFMIALNMTFSGARSKGLAVPVYLHPKEPLAQDFKRLYKTHP